MCTICFCSAYEVDEKEVNKSPGKKQQDYNLKNADKVKETKAKDPRKIKTRKRKRFERK